MNKIKLNFIYQSAYQMLLLILPLVTAPYMSRVLGAEGVGIYTYSATIVGYFALFSKLGIDTYANREVAKARDNKYKLSELFSDIFTLHAIISLIVVFVYIAFVGNFINDNRIIFWLQLFTLMSHCFDISWLFFGIEEFKLTVIRNVSIKVISVILIFVFVKKAADLWIYTIIMSLSALISQLILWRYVRKYIHYEKPNFTRILVHIKPMLILFIPSIAMSIYRQIDKVMLGVMSSYGQVGFYEYAEKIINAPIGLISALGTVMLPRMSNMYENNQKKEAINAIENSMTFIMFLALACGMGLYSISSDFIPMFFGEEFLSAVNVLKILSISIPIIAWSNVIRTQYLLPSGKDNFFVISMVMGAVINVVANYGLIPKYGASGAAVGTIFTQIVILLVQTMVAKKDLPILTYIKNTLWFIISALIMAIVVKTISLKIDINVYVLIIIEICAGILVYMALNYKNIKKLLKTGVKR